MKKQLIYLVFLALVYSCTEPYALITNNSDNYLVVEATITNENKKQLIKLSRTFNFQENQNTFESGATVYLKDNFGTVYPFEEVNEVYESVAAFQAEPNLNYQLYITTNDGEQYQSTIQELSGNSQIEEITSNVETNYGIRGVSIKVKRSDQDNNAKFFRYEYEETYKIIAPFWSTDSLTTAGNACDPDDRVPEQILFEIFDAARGNDESRICYNTTLSKDIILYSNNSLNNTSTNFEVLFLSQENPAIANRYSILIKQYSQSQEAYNYYFQIKKLSNNTEVLSPTQPGYVVGNIKCQTNSKNKVIGFFEVAAYSKMRHFFNYDDLFPGESKPDYFEKCKVQIYDIRTCTGGYGLGNLVRLTNQKAISVFKNERPSFQTVFIACSDCRVLGSNKVPSFWVD